MTEREVESLRADFPLIQSGGVIYFDNAATMQKPQIVIDRVREFCERENANPLRGLYDLSVQATEQVELARAKVAKLMGAKRPEEIVFTKNATEAINITAEMVGRKFAADDEIIIFLESHHSNFLPWLDLQRRYRIGVKMTISKNKIKPTPNTRLVVFTGMSNVTGAEIVAKVNPGVLKSVDLAQTIAHRKVNVVKEKIDLAQWSGHKIGGPMGVGVLYGRHEILNSLEPIFYGGEMVDGVKFQRGQMGVNLAELPRRLEAGTINAEGIVGLSTAIDYWETHEPEKLFRYVDELTEYLAEKIAKIAEVELVGAAHGVVSFKIADVHPHDVAQILAEEKICVRAGYHCAQPLLDVVLQTGPVVRASLAFYNTRAEIDRMIAALKTVRRKMSL